MNRKIAIDFGTTNTLVAEWVHSEQQAKILRCKEISIAPGEQVPPLIPSCLYIYDENKPLFYVGNQVISKGVNNNTSTRYFWGFKRRIIATYKSYPRKINGCEFDDQKVAGLFLKRVIEYIPEIDAQNDLIFTLPVESFELYAKWIMDRTNNILPESTVSFVDESTAAAIGYGIVNANALVLVVDFGGGTLDISLVRLQLSRSGNNERQAQVIAKAGTMLGGEDIDLWILEDVLKENGKLLDDIGHIYPGIKQETERVKIELSRKNEVEFNYFDAEDFVTYALDYSRDRLENLLMEKGFLTKMQHVLDDVLYSAHAKGISKHDIEKVLLVGGTCLVPSVQRAIIQNFGNQKVLCDKPFEAVSYGALLLLHGLEIEDYIQHSYGIRHLNPSTGTHTYTTLFKSGMIYPTKKALELELQCSRYNQEAIELVIVEIQNSSDMVSEVIFDGQCLISIHNDIREKTIVPLNEKRNEITLARLVPPGNPGAPRLRVTFNINSKKKLIVTVEDLMARKIVYKDLAVVDIT